MITWIFARDVGGAIEGILQRVLLDIDKKVYYFDGWDGFGASAVLRSMAQELPSRKFEASAALRSIAQVLPSRKTPSELCFDKIIYIDCSAWKSRRAMQRAIAEELKLDDTTMALFDKQDEEDDFEGVDRGSRDVIVSAAAVIHQTLKDCRFMMIFLNGCDDEVYVESFGVPSFTRFGNNILIWTFKRSFLTMHRRRSEIADKLRYTHFLLYSWCGIGGLTSSEFRALLHQEAATIVARHTCMRGIDPTMVADCCLYELFLHYNFHSTTRFGWAAHASNYWICDGIIQWDRAREIGNALHREISWECDASLLDDVLKKFMEHLEPRFLVVEDGDVYEEGPYRWISLTSRNAEVHGMQSIPAVTSSFFLAFESSDDPSALPNGFFEHSSNLGVLTLSCCAFNFASPPFLKCHSLRFLGLDHYTDQKKTGEGEDHTEWACLYSLWVLDLRYTDWNEILSQEKMDLMANLQELNIEGVRCWQYTSQLQGRVPYLHRLRIIKPTCEPEKSIDTSNSFLDKTKLAILDLSGNSEMDTLPNSLSKASSLQVLVLDGCNGLENIVPDGLPHLLRSISIDGYGPESHWTPTIELPPKNFRLSIVDKNDAKIIKNDAKIIKISLEGCTQLENVFLRGLPNLVELDLSGTAIKILDFKTMVVEVLGLKRLFLLGCERLRTIIWDESSSQIQPDLELLCIDTRAGIRCSRPSIHMNKSFRLQVHAIITDVRFIRSLWSLISHREKSSLKDVFFNIHITSSHVYSSGVVQLDGTCKEKIDPGDQVSLQQLVPAGQYSDILSMVGVAPMKAFPHPPTTKLGRHIEDSKGILHYLYVESMHVPINMFMGEWEYLRQCRVERCPKLRTVFTSSQDNFEELQTIWVSDLLMARCIWDKGWRTSNSLKNLRHLHLRSCPRLQSVLPVWVSSFPILETLHIIHCGDLRHVFVLDEDYPEEIADHGVAFPKLSTIHLHDLPMLQQICKVKMVVPALETIKIRGCWGLRRLLAVVARGRDRRKPAVEIEKDVWDALEWDGVEAGHHPDLFEAPIHARYYKKKLPKVSVLR